MAQPVGILSKIKISEENLHLATKESPIELFYGYL